MSARGRCCCTGAFRGTELTANDVAKVLYETAAIMNGIPGERQGAGLVNAGAAVNHVV